MSLSFKNKKGNAIGFGIVMFLILFTLSIYTVYLYSAVNPFYEDLIDEFNESGYNDSRDMIQRANDTYPSFWDGTIVFAFIMIWIASLLSAYLIDSKPIFFIITVTLVAPLLFVGMGLSVVYEDIMSASSITAFVVQFPMSYWIMTNLLALGIVQIISVAAVVYAKDKL